MYQLYLVHGFLLVFDLQIFTLPLRQIIPFTNRFWKLRLGKFFSLYKWHQDRIIQSMKPVVINWYYMELVCMHVVDKMERGN